MPQGLSLAPRPSAQGSFRRRLPLAPRRSFLPGETGGLPDELAVSLGLSPQPSIPEELLPVEDLAPEYMSEVRRRIPAPMRRPELGPGAYEVGGEVQNEPGTLKKILAAIATGWQGGVGGPEAAQKTYGQIFETPYARAMQDYETQEGLRAQRVKELAPAMGLYEDRAERQSLAPIRRMTAEAQLTGAEAERMRAEAALAPKPRDPIHGTSGPGARPFIYTPEGFQYGEQTPFAPKEEPQPRPSFDDSQIIGSLRAKLKRDPTEAEFLQEKQRLQVQLSSQRADVTTREILERMRARPGQTEADIAAYVEGIRSRNIKSITAVPSQIRGLVLQRAAESGALVVSQGESDYAGKLANAESLVDDLELYSRRLYSDPFDYEAAFVLNGLRQATAGVFSKGVFAEVGVLTDADIARVKALIPGIVSSVFMPGVTEERFRELRVIIGKAKTSQRGGTIPGLQGGGASDFSDLGGTRVR